MHLIAWPKRLVAEGLGTAFLLAMIVGSGIMADQLCAGNVGLALLCNALATGAGLLVLILIFGPISGAHFNPVVSLVAAFQKELSWRAGAAYGLVQVLGAVIGVISAHLMFGLPMAASQHIRTGPAQWFSEALATFGLLATILGVSRQHARLTPFAVAAYVISAYWFTSSTSFANPAVTLARALTDTFAGIRPVDVPAFVLAQGVGAMAAMLVLGWLIPPPRSTA